MLNTPDENLPKPHPNLFVGDLIFDHFAAVSIKPMKIKKKIKQSFTGTAGFASQNSSVITSIRPTDPLPGSFLSLYIKDSHI